MTGPARCQPTTAAPDLWVAWHPSFGFYAETASLDEQTAAAKLMRFGIAGNHGWSIIQYAALESEKTP